MSVKDPGSRLLRWCIKLEEYNYEIVYKPGVQNSNADALSRIGALASEGNDSDEIDSDMKLKILQENHDSILGVHRGMNKTHESIDTLSVAKYEEGNRGLCKGVREMSNK